MKQIKFFLIITVLFLWFPFSLNAQILEQTFEDQAAHFKISLPNQQWFMEPRGTDPGKLRWMAKFESPLDLFVPNVTVRTEPVINQNENLEEWLQKNIALIEGHLEVYSKENINTNGKNGFEVIFLDPNHDIVFLQRFFQGTNQHYILTATSKRASFFRMEEEFKKIFNSFEII